MKRIYKYPLTSNHIDLMLPNPKFLHVGVQFGMPHVWVEIDMDGTPTPHAILSVATGDQPPEDAEFLGTFFNDTEGTLVFHVYIRKLIR